MRNLYVFCSDCMAWDRRSELMEGMGYCCCTLSPHFLTFTTPVQGCREGPEWPVCHLLGEPDEVANEQGGLWNPED